MEFDLIAYCGGTRLSGLFTGDLSWRLLGVLIRGLPSDSRTMTAIRDATPERVLKAPPPADASYGPWSREAMLLAHLIDVAEWLRWSKTKDAEQGRNRPEPFPRPGVARKAAPVAATAPTADVINLFEYMREHSGAIPAEASGRWASGPTGSA